MQFQNECPACRFTKCINKAVCSVKPSYNHHPQSNVNYKESVTDEKLINCKKL